MRKRLDRTSRVALLDGQGRSESGRAVPQSMTLARGSRTRSFDSPLLLNERNQVAHLSRCHSRLQSLRHQREPARFEALDLPA